MGRDAEMAVPKSTRRFFPRFASAPTPEASERGGPRGGPRLRQHDGASVSCAAIGKRITLKYNIVLVTKHAASPRRVTTFRIDADLLDGLQEVWERDGVAVSEQVRRAIRMWLEQKGVLKVERKRPASRKRR